MALTTAGLPCDPWDPIWCGPIPNVTGSPATTGWAVEAATEVLWALSGRQFGTCTVTSRPCRRTCAADIGMWIWSGRTTYPQPALIGGSWFNLTCGSCGTDCSCTSLAEFILPGPVAEVIEITIGGEVMPTGSYRVDDYRKVVRQDGGSWPSCQDLTQPLGEEGTWGVTYSYGQPVPQSGRLAVGELAIQFLKACDANAGGDCALPPNLQSLIREGVSLQFTEDVQSRLQTDGRLGIWAVDVFLVTFNPKGLQTRSRVYSPDVPRPRVTG